MLRLFWHSTAHIPWLTSQRPAVPVPASDPDSARAPAHSRRNSGHLPCPFTPGHAVGNLRRAHLRDIWTDLAAGRFRHDMAVRAAANGACAGRAKYRCCLGGCPVMDLMDCSKGYLTAGAT